MVVQRYVHKLTVSHKLVQKHYDIPSKQSILDQYINVLLIPSGVATCAWIDSLSKIYSKKRSANRQLIDYLLVNRNIPNALA